MSWKREQRTVDRNGSIMVVVLVMIVALLAFVALSVDVGYMQLSKTELQIAADAAAKAATRRLSQTNGDATSAAVEGIRVARENSVAGKPMRLNATDFQFGQPVKNVDGTWGIDVGKTPFTAVRVTANKSVGSTSGSVRLLFGPILGVDHFDPIATASATFPLNDIVISVDRSHSMCFDDFSTGSWHYPAGVPDADYSGDGYYNWIDALLSPPHPTGSRWSSVQPAVDKFLEVSQAATSQKPAIGLVTWGSYLGSSTYEYYLTGETVQATTREVSIGHNYSNISTAIANKLNSRMLGGTDIAAGVDEAVAMLTSRSQLSKKTIVLMTDGVETAGRGVVHAARDAKSEGVVIHTVTFMNGDQSAMANVATITGGRHIHASNNAELVEAFEELAKLQPVSLVE